MMNARAGEIGGGGFVLSGGLQRDALSSGPLSLALFSVLDMSSTDFIYPRQILLGRVTLEMGRMQHPAIGPCYAEREIFIDNLLVQVHLIIEMSRPALRHGSLNSLFQVALYLPS